MTIAARRTVAALMAAAFLAASGAAGLIARPHQPVGASATSMAVAPTTTLYEDND